MQYHYEDRPLVWHDVPGSRLSRRSVTYRARIGSHERASNRVRIFSGRQTAPLTRLLPKLFIVLAALLVIIAAFCALSEGADASSDSGETEYADRSTVRDQWIKGRVPYLYQTDREWAGTSYAGSTVADSGCGPTCMAMVYVALTGKKDRDPAQMAAFSEQKGFIEEGMTRGAFMTEGARMLGLKSEELSADEQAIRSALAAGHPIIVSVSKGDFTTRGHFIVLEGVDAFGRILIRDPNSPERSAQAWDLSRILAQSRNLWAFSV